MNELGNKREPAQRYPTEVQLISTEWLMVKRALIYASKLVKDRDLRSPVEHSKLVLEGWPGQIRPRSQNTAPVLNDCSSPNHSERCHNFASESSSGHLLSPLANSGPKQRVLERARVGSQADLGLNLVSDAP